MTYLLDTHVFLWTILSPKDLSSKARGIILNSENKIYVSTVTFWEISMKYNLGKLKLSKFTPESLVGCAEETGLSILDLSPRDAASSFQLSRKLHKDPFDRMLVWQSIQNKMILLSKDHDLMVYEKSGLKMVW